VTKHLHKEKRRSADQSYEPQINNYLSLTEISAKSTRVLG